LTRWEPDRVVDGGGWRFWIRDLSTRRARPLFCASPERTMFVPGPGVAGWCEEAGALEIRTEVCVAPADDVELRTITITNRGRVPRTIDVTGCVELVLHDPVADAAHPAFSKLFVQTARIAGRPVVTASRRPRSPEESHPHVAHTIVGEGGFEVETDRF